MLMHKSEHENIAVTFDDVLGWDEAKLELEEIMSAKVLKECRKYVKRQRKEPSVLFSPMRLMLWITNEQFVVIIPTQNSPSISS